VAKARNAILVGAAAGAAAQYFLDPVLGRTRRVKARDRLAAGIRRPARKLEDEAGKRVQMAGDRASGLAHELTSTGTPPPTDRALVDKIRSEVIGWPQWAGYTINVHAADGAVTLRGQLDRPQQVGELEDAVRRVPGVRSVESFLHPPGTQPENVREATEASQGD
jgi:osmotically-inducible protein OsmY